MRRISVDVGRHHLDRAQLRQVITQRCVPGVVAVERGFDGGSGVVCVGRQVQCHHCRSTNLADDLGVRLSAPDQACGCREGAQVCTELQRGNRIRACREGDGILRKVRARRRVAIGQVLVIQRQGDHPAIGTRYHRAGTIGHRDGVGLAVRVVVAILGTQREAHVHTAGIVQTVGWQEAPGVVCIDRQRALAGVNTRAQCHRPCSTAVDRDREVGGRHTIGSCSQAPRTSDGRSTLHHSHRSRQRHHRYVVHDGDIDAAIGCTSTCAQYRDCDLVLQGVVALCRGVHLGSIQRVFVADRACLVVGPRGVSRDSKSSFTRIYGWQQTDIPQQLSQAEAHATNRDGADAIAGTYGDAAASGFAGGFLTQTGFVDRLCVTTDPSLWRGLFWRNHPARNDICRWCRHRAWVLQGEGRCVFNHAGQAHIGAACTITASQGCRSGIQLRQGILALIQCRDQCIDIRICRIRQR